MTEIPGFTNLREVRVLQGQPTSSFVTAWRDWNKARPKKDKSIFPDPSRKSNYSEDQLWAVVEMDHAGLDLEHPSVKIDTLWSLWDVFWGVAIALAKGEEDVSFEHRDLHLGNICVTQTRADHNHRLYAFEGRSREQYHGGAGRRLHRFGEGGDLRRGCVGELSV